MPETEIPAPRRRAITSTALLLGGFAAVLANWHYEVFRFSWPALNAVALLAGLALPLVALVLGGGRLTGVWRVASYVVLFPAVIYSLFCGFFVTMQLLFTLGDGGDRSFERLGAVPVEGGRVGIYRTNCGPTCNYGVAVRHERKLLPGVLLVKRLKGFYPAGLATVEALGPRTVRVSVPSSGGRGADSVRSRGYVVKPYVYF